MQISGYFRHSCTFAPPDKSKISCFNNVSLCTCHCTLRKSLYYPHIQCTHPSQNLLGEILLSILYWKPCKKSLVRFPAKAYFSFSFLCLLPVAHSSAKHIQMISSMTFAQSNGCKDIDLISYIISAPDR